MKYLKLFESYLNGGKTPSKKNVFLFENFNKAKNILSKQGKTLEDEEFKKLKDLVTTKGYIGLFTKLHFIDGVGLEKLEHLNNRLDKNKAIIGKLKTINGMNVVDYAEDIEGALSSIERLEDDLTRLESQHAKNKIYKELPKKWKNLLESSSQEKRDEFNSLAEQLGKSTEYKVMFKKLAKVKDLDELLENMYELLDKIKGGLDYDSILDKIQNIEKYYDPSKFEGADYNQSDDDYYFEYYDHETEDEIDDPDDITDDMKKAFTPYARLEYNKDGIVVAYIGDFMASKILGSEAWCISSDIGYWQQYSSEEIGYIRNRTNIYFIWDFNKKRSDDLHQVGTVIEYKSIGSTHDMKDNSITLKKLPYYPNIKDVLDSNTDYDWNIVEYMAERGDEILDNFDGDAFREFIIYAADDSIEDFFKGVENLENFCVKSNVDEYEILSDLIGIDDYDRMELVVEIIEEKDPKFFDDIRRVEDLIEEALGTYNNELIDYFHNLTVKHGIDKKFLNVIVEKYPNNIEIFSKIIDSIEGTIPMNHIPLLEIYTILKNKNRLKNVAIQRGDDLLYVTSFICKTIKKCDNIEVTNWILDNFIDYDNKEIFDMVIKKVVGKSCFFPFESYKIFFEKFVKGNKELEIKTLKTFISRQKDSDFVDMNMKWYMKQVEVDTKAFRFTKPMDLEEFKKRMPYGDYTVYDLYNFLSMSFYNLEGEKQEEYVKVLIDIFNDFDYSVKLLKHDISYNNQNSCMCVLNVINGNLSDKMRVKILDTFYGCIEDDARLDFLEGVLSYGENFEYNIREKLFTISEKWFDFGISDNVMSSMSDSYRLEMCKKYKSGDKEYVTKCLEDLFEPKRHTSLHSYTYKEYLKEYLELGAEVTEKLKGYFMQHFKDYEDRWGYTTDELYNSLRDNNIIGFGENYPISLSDNFYENLTEKGYPKLAEVISKDVQKTQ
jgi:hypothetical protein